MWSKHTNVQLWLRNTKKTNFTWWHSFTLSDWSASPLLQRWHKSIQEADNSMRSANLGPRPHMAELHNVSKKTICERRSPINVRLNKLLGASFNNLCQSRFSLGIKKTGFSRQNWQNQQESPGSTRYAICVWRIFCPYGITNTFLIKNEISKSNTINNGNRGLGTDIN